MTTVTGKFENRKMAEAAAKALVRRGYPAHLISIAPENESGCKVDIQHAPMPTNDLAALFLRPASWLGTLGGGFALGGIAAYYCSLGYLHMAWVFAMFAVGAYVGLLFGTMMPYEPEDKLRSPRSVTFSSSPVIVKICTTPHQSSTLSEDLRSAGATHIYNHYTV